MPRQKVISASKSRIDTRYGLYRIIAGQHVQECRAIAYLGDRQRFIISASNVDEAVREVQRLIDERTARASENRDAGVPCMEEFLDALETIRKDLSPQLIKALRLHCNRREYKATFAELARLVNLSVASVEAEYARLGTQVGTLLTFRPAPKWLDRSFAGILVLAVPTGEHDIHSPFCLSKPFADAIAASW